MQASYTGSWSPYTLIIAVLMMLSGLVLLVVLLVSGLTGRLGTRMPPAEDETEAPDENEDEGESGEEGSESEAGKAKPLKPARRETGWWQLLAAIGCSLPATAAFFWIDNVYGRLSGFTAGAALALCSLAGQVFFVVWFVRLQRNS